MGEEFKIDSGEKERRGRKTGRREERGEKKERVRGEEGGRDRNRER